MSVAGMGCFSDNPLTAAMCGCEVILGEVKRPLIAGLQSGFCYLDGNDIQITAPNKSTVFMDGGEGLEYP